MSDAPDLLAAVTSGDRRAALVALRDHLAADYVAADVRSKASIALQLRQVLNDLDALSDDVEVDPLDELARRRATPTPLPERPAGKRKRRTASG